MLRRRPAAAVDSAALVAQVPEEPAVPVRARLVLVRQPVLADLLLRPAVLVPALWRSWCSGRSGRTRCAWRPPAGPGALVLEPAVPVHLLLSRQSFSAAMARSTPQPATNVRAGTEIKVTTERPSLPLNVTELDSGSWVIFQLPGFTTAASGTEQSSLDALRKASDTSYFKDNGCTLGQGRLQR